MGMTQRTWTRTEQNVLAASREHAAEIVTRIVRRDYPTAQVDVAHTRRTPGGRYTVTYNVLAPVPVSDTHTVRGKPIGPEGVPYGTTHDMDCPGCAGTPYLLSPRSETYWSS